MGDGDHEACNTSLQLGLGRCGYAPTPEMRKRDKPLVCLDLSFEVRPKAGMIGSFEDHIEIGSSLKTDAINEHEKDRRSSDRADGEIADSTNGARKKLRLTKEQTTLLEDSFKRHSTLHPTQKQALARLLNLKPRQVEVWFQNRRARTKLKQTEVDFEFLKKWCESLSDENEKLKKELQELKLLGANEALFTQQNPKTTTTTLAICPSCETKVKANDQYPINEAAAKN